MTPPPVDAVTPDPAHAVVTIVTGSALPTS
jgi:hypothetical protein